jgi:hypothetical protein
MNQDLTNFERIASIHPYSIYYSLGEDEYDMPETRTIWSRITSLRRLDLAPLGDASQILATQTGLTWLDIRLFSPHIRHCTNLLELTIRLPELYYYKYIPSSVTRLQIVIGE